MMRWYFILWLASGQSISLPFESQQECLTNLEAELATVIYGFGETPPVGICLQGILRRKGAG